MIEKNKVYSFDDLKEAYESYITIPKDRKLIEDAYAYADKKHEGQVRKSGDPYIVHPIAVAYFLAKLHAGPETIAAGLLHDTQEDTGTKNSELSTRFGPTVASLVEALTKIADVTHRHDLHIMAEDHRKIFVAMAKDVRVIIIKLCDRLHNMSTLDFQPRASQIRISNETMYVYAPIAHRLGLYKIQLDLEDMSLYYLKPDEYKHIQDLLNSKHEDMEAATQRFKNRLDDILSKTNIPYTISARVKSIYSIYKKMFEKKHDFNEIYDLMALRIITENENQCYEILGYIHANFKPIPGRFKDYIAMPKPNLYQSLHTTVLNDDGSVFEVQIRTKDMDETAEEGVAAHWRYKENTNYDARREQEEIENQLHWFRDFVSITSENAKDESAQEYVHTLQHDIFDANVYVFTPMGKVICLPSGSTPIDFAYRIHTQVGDSLSGAKINKVLVPIGTQLKTGDICEILTSKDAHPNQAWLNQCKSSFARTRIRKYLTKMNEDFVRKDNISKGRQSLIDSFHERKLNVDVDQIVNKDLINHFGCDDEDSFYLLMLGKKITPQQIVDYLGLKKDAQTLEQEIVSNNNRHQIASKKVEDVVLLENGDRAMMTLAACCRPIPGDDIVGYITKGNGIKVHRTDCPNIKHEEERLVKVIWNDFAPRTTHPVDLAVICQDRPGLLVDVMNTLSLSKVNALNLNAKLKPEQQKCIISLTIAVNSQKDLELATKYLLGIKNVLEVNRVIH